MFSAEPSLIASAAAIIFAAALVSSIAGLAFSALVSAALLHVYHDPVRAVAVVVICSIAIQGYSVWALRRVLEWRRLAPFLLGGTFTVPVGVFLLTHIPTRIFSLCLGLIVIAYAVFRLRARELRVANPTQRGDVVAGAVGGLLGGLAGSPSLVVSIWCGLRGWTKEQQRAVYQPYILLMQLEALACLGAATPERIPPEGLLYVPAAIVAAYAGLAIFRRMSAAQFHLAFHLLLIAAGVSLVYQIPGTP